jgi:anaphase-promoting complex subunit 1
MAGSGDLKTLTMLRILRKRLLNDKNTNYGFLQAINHAIGILFLGAGGMTLSNTKQSIALLYISLYPIFAVETNDNDKYLQPLRHLYVLACETNILEVRELDSGKIVRTDMIIHYYDNNCKTVKSPMIVKYINIR